MFDAHEDRAPHTSASLAEGPALLREMSAVGAGLYLTGGALILAVLPFASWSDMDRGWLVVFALVALVAGAGLLVASRTRPAPIGLLEVLATLGTLNVSGTVLASGPQGSGSFGVLYVFVSAFCFYYFPLWVAVAQVSFAAIAYGATLFVLEPVDPLAQWTVITGGNVIVGALLGFVGQRMRVGLRREHEAANRLRDLDELKTAFLRAVSHELRTPLTSMLGNTVTIRTHRDRMSHEQVDHLLERAEANARRLEALLVDLLDVDRVTRGVLEPLVAPTDLEALTHGVVDVLGLRERVTEIAVRGDVVLAVEAGKVERVLENLLANGVRHTPPDTPLRVTLDGTEEAVRLSVEDRGPGVPDELKRAVFEPFRQGAAASRSASPGTGIGLALVAKFAELHGGSAWVEDREGGGARFTVHLPRSSAACADTAPAPRRPVAVSPGQGARPDGR